MFKVEIKQRSTVTSGDQQSCRESLDAQTVACCSSAVVSTGFGLTLAFNMDRGEYSTSLNPALGPKTPKPAHSLSPKT